MQCVNCGFENIPGMQQCVRCQSSLELATVEVAPPRARRGRVGSRLRRGWNGLDELVREFTREFPFGWLRVGRLEYVPREAVLLSVLVPGLGHIRYGGATTGWVLLSSWLGLLASSAAVYGSVASGWLLCGALLVHGASVASLLVQTLAERTLVKRCLWSLATYAAIGLGVYVPLQMLVGQFYLPYPIREMTAFSSIFSRGDIVLCQGPWRRPRVFDRGDIVLYGIGYGYGRRWYGYGLDCIVGVPGDVVACKDGRLLLNSRPMPAEQLPLGLLPRDLADFEVRAGADEYLILPTSAEMHVQDRRRAAPLVAEASKIPAQHIIGRVVFRTYPLSRWGSIP